MIQRGYSHAREEHKQIVEDKDKQQLNYLVNQPGVTLGGPSRQAAFSRSWVTGRCWLGTGEGEGGWRCSLLLHLDLGSRGAAAWVQRKGAGVEGKARQGSG